MKIHLKLLLAAALCLQLTPVQAQMGRPGGGPQMNAATAKLFGDQQTFSANLEVILNQGQEMTLPGKIDFDNGKTRMEINMNEAKGGAMAQNAERMKAMGMDRMVMIIQPGGKSQMVFPGLKAYAPAPEAETSSTNIAAFKLENTKLGEETVDGKECVKNKAVVTDDQGKTHEFTTWYAKSLKNFPVKIQMKDEGTEVTTLFKDIKFAKPDAAQFAPPADFKSYDNFMTMMQEEVAKRMQQQGGMPGGN